MPRSTEYLIEFLSQVSCTEIDPSGAGNSLATICQEAAKRLREYNTVLSCDTLMPIKRAIDNHKVAKSKAGKQFDLIEWIEERLRDKAA